MALGARRGTLPGRGLSPSPQAPGHHRKWGPESLGPPRPHLSFCKPVLAASSPGWWEPPQLRCGPRRPFRSNSDLSCVAQVTSVHLFELYLFTLGASPCFPGRHELVHRSWGEENEWTHERGRCVLPRASLGSFGSGEGTDDGSRPRSQLLSLGLPCARPQVVGGSPDCISKGRHEKGCLFSRPDLPLIIV